MTPADVERVLSTDLEGLVSALISCMGQDPGHDCGDADTVSDAVGAALRYTGWVDVVEVITQLGIDEKAAVSYVMARMRAIVESYEKLKYV